MTSCQQSNEGQQIAGEDNDAKGFNDQSDNLAASAVSGKLNKLNRLSKPENISVDLNGYIHSNWENKHFFLFFRMSVDYAYLKLL